MKVRELLTPLYRDDLRRLCIKRELPVSGTKEDRLKRLARSYRGDVEAVLEDLSKDDLLDLADRFRNACDIPTGFRSFRAAD